MLFYLKSLVDRNSEDEINMEILVLVIFMLELMKVKFLFDKIVKYKVEESEVFKMYLEFLDMIDKYGLLKIIDEFCFNFYGVEYKDYVLYYY